MVPPVIIVCEQCQTRFQLDAARIPARGAKVRCSRCKHAFHVAHPDAQPHAVVAEAIAAASQPSAPEPSVDLGVTSSPEVAAPLEKEENEEQDWEFNEDGPLGGAQRADAVAAKRDAAAETAAELEATEATASSDLELDFSFPSVQALAEARSEADRSEAAPGAPPPSPLEALGSPEEWDFLAGDAEAAGSPERGVELGGSMAGPRSQPDSGVVAPPFGALQLSPDAAPASAGSAARLPGLQYIGQLLHVAGFSLAAGMLLLGLVQVGWEATRRPAVGALPTRIEIPGGHVQDVQLHFVENIEAGTLAVVTGHYVAGPAGTLLRLQWSSGAGPIRGASVLAGLPVPERWLREGAPEALAQVLAQTAPRLARAGEETAFQAVFRSVPANAALLVMTGEPLPAEGSTSPPADTPAQWGKRGAAPALPAKASRPPSPLPSSG